MGQPMTCKWYLGLGGGGTQEISTPKVDSPSIEFLNVTSTKVGPSEPRMVPTPISN